LNQVVLLSTILMLTFPEEEKTMKIKLDTKKLLGFRLYSAEAVNGKQGNKNGDMDRIVGLKIGGLAGEKCPQKM